MLKIYNFKKKENALYKYSYEVLTPYAKNNKIYSHQKYTLSLNSGDKLIVYP